MSMNNDAFEEQNNLNAQFPIMLSLNQHAFSFPAHYHRWLEAVYILKGEMSISVNSRHYDLTEGDMMIIGSYHIHSYGIKDSKDASFYMLRLDWNCLSELTSQEAYYEFVAPVLLKSNLIKAEDPVHEKGFHKHLMSIHKASSSEDPGSRLQILADTYALLGAAARHIRAAKTHAPLVTKELHKSFDMMRRINGLIYDHYTREIPLVEASEAAGYSLYHFTRRFKAITGLTFKTYLNNFRIAMIKEALTATDLPITELALRHGFNSLKSFNRNFLSVTGMTPSDYRKRNL